MPMPPLPSAFICPQCGWQRTTTPASDALRLNIDWFVSERASHLAGGHPVVRQQLGQGAGLLRRQAHE
ncbi:hypothetical protein EQ832_26100, partial [Pseudomonas sp. ALS1131]